MLLNRNKLEANEAVWLREGEGNAAGGAGSFFRGRRAARPVTTGAGGESPLPGVRGPARVGPSRVSTEPFAPSPESGAGWGAGQGGSLPRSRRWGTRLRHARCPLRALPWLATRRGRLGPRAPGEREENAPFGGGRRFPSADAVWSFQM